MGYEHLTHTFAPVFDARSRILVLGSFPSAKSREINFYYGHPKNRFWQVMANVLGEATPTDVAEKKLMLLSHGVALWDVIASCDIAGSSDASIRNVVPNDMGVVFGQADIRAVFANGGTAYRLYEKYCLPTFEGMPPTRLPSTSPANAAWGFDRLTAAWRAALHPVLDYMQS